LVAYPPVEGFIFLFELSMKIISWNVQGLKKPQVVQEIFLLKRKFNPDILFLLETLVNEKNLLRILPTLGFDFF